MRIYVEAYTAAGEEVLGNLDGQACLDCKNYRRTKHYKRLRLENRNRLSLNGRVAQYRFVTADGTCLETIVKP